MQMRKKLYIFKHFAKSKKLFFCQYLSFSVWFPLSLKHWSPLIVIHLSQLIPHRLTPHCLPCPCLFYLRTEETHTSFTTYPPSSHSPLSSLSLSSLFKDRGESYIFPSLSPIVSLPAICPCLFYFRTEESHTSFPPYRLTPRCLPYPCLSILGQRRVIHLSILSPIISLPAVCPCLFYFRTEESHTSLPPYRSLPAVFPIPVFSILGQRRVIHHPAYPSSHSPLSSLFLSFLF